MYINKASILHHQPHLLANYFEIQSNISNCLQLNFFPLAVRNCYLRLVNNKNEYKYGPGKAKYEKEKYSLTKLSMPRAQKVQSIKQNKEDLFEEWIKMLCELQ